MTRIRDNVRLSEKNGTQRGPLYVPEELKDPAYVYQWVNDTGYKLSSAQDKGFDFTPASELSKLSKGVSERGIREGTATDGTRVCRIVGTDMKAYLMRMPKEVAAERKKLREQAAADAVALVNHGAGADGLSASLSSSSVILND